MQNQRSAAFISLVFFVGVSILFNVVITKRVSLPFNNSINKVDVCDENIVVIGESFVALIPKIKFQSGDVQIIESSKGKKFSFLAIDDTCNLFLTCYENTSEAKCTKCSNTSCEADFCTLPNFTLEGFARIRNRHLRIITSSNSKRNSRHIFLTQRKYPCQSGVRHIFVKSGWLYEVLHVYFVGPSAYSLSNVLKTTSGESYSAFSKFEETSLTEFFFRSSCGKPVSIVGYFRQDGKFNMFFIGEDAKLCVVPWSFEKYGYKKITERFTSDNFGGYLWDEKQMQESYQVQGFEESLWKNESVSSGVVVNGPDFPLLLLATQQGRILKVNIS